MSTPGQISFDGREVQAVKLSFPGLGEKDYEPEAGGTYTLQTGDVLECTIRFVVDGVAHNEKHDKDGVATDVLKRVHVLKPIWRGLSIDTIYRREEMEDAWRNQHGAVS